MRICIANLLLFVSLYMLFPVLPLCLPERLGISPTGVTNQFLFFLMGMLLIGPFHAYLIDAYKRKSIYLIACVALLVSTAGYLFLTNETELALLCGAQGVAFGMATTAGITLAIDVTHSALRSAGNVNYLWIARLGMMIGVILGTMLFPLYPLKSFLALSVGIGLAGMLFAMGVYVPFRAPFVTKFYSCDRFLLPRAWLSAINLMLITFVVGLFILPVHSWATVQLGESVQLPFVLWMGIGFLLAALLACLPLLKVHFSHPILLGLVLECVALWGGLEHEGVGLVTPLLLGTGFGLITPKFLKLFVGLSQHCQRATANSTYLLAGEMGVFLGMVYASHADSAQLCLVAKVVITVALLLFVLATLPYYKKLTAVKSEDDRYSI